MRVGKARGNGRREAQTSSIQKQMEKVMIICLANAAQSGRDVGVGKSRVRGRERPEGCPGQGPSLYWRCAYAPWHI